MLMFTLLDLGRHAHSPFKPLKFKCFYVIFFNLIKQISVFHSKVWKTASKIHCPFKTVDTFVTQEVVSPLIVHVHI